jgi:hypothetical protein
MGSGVLHGTRAVDGQTQLKVKEVTLRLTRYLLLFDSYGLVFCGAPTLATGRVCLSYMLLAHASAVFLGSESLATRTIFYYLRFETSLFVFSYDSQGHGGGIRPRLHTGIKTQLSLSLWVFVTTDGQSASLSWYKAPIRGLRPDFYFRTEYGIRLTVTFLIPWGALSDERTGLSFVCAAGPCQRSLFRS